MHPLILAAASKLPQIPADWPGWVILIILILLAAAGLRRWLKS